MDGRFGFHLFFVLLRITAAVSLKEETFNITEDMYMSCPYSYICNRNASLQLSDAKTTPCCKSCSCAPDCGLHMNCCYERLDTYKLVDSLQLVCVTIEYDEHFYMVDKCLSNVTEINQCRETVGEVGIVDNLAPVSSMDTHLVYYNAECAKCNGVHEYTTWNYKLNCIDVLSKTLQHGIKKDSNCSQIYLQPNLEDWETRKCYKTANVTCEQEYIGLAEACQNVKAPYIHEGFTSSTLYDNIFCAMCSGIKQLGDVCRSSTKSVFSSLSTVIDGTIRKDVLKTLLQEYPTHIDQTDEQCLQTEVNDPYKNTCRHLYCPDGMIRIDSECIYFTKQWIVVYYTVQIELRPYPGTQLKTSSIESLGMKDRKYPARWMHSTCMDDNWADVEVFLKLNELNNTETHIVQSLIVRLYMLTENTSGFDPSVVIPHIGECIRERWLLTIDGHEYPFRADLYKYRRYVQDGNMARRHSITFIEDYQPKLYELIANDPRDYGNTVGRDGHIDITKLLFCQQVRLDLSEVDVGYNEIRISSHDLVLGDNEYNVYRGIILKGNDQQIDDNLTTIAICLEDFNYDAWRKLQPQTNDCDETSLDSFIYLVIVVVIPALRSFVCC